MVWIYCSSLFLTSTPIKSLFQQYKTTYCSRNALCTFLTLYLSLRCFYAYYILSLVFLLWKTIFKGSVQISYLLKGSSWPPTSPSKCFFPSLWSLSYSTQIAELCVHVFPTLPQSNWTQGYVLHTFVFTKPSGFWFNRLWQVFPFCAVTSCTWCWRCKNKHVCKKLWASISVPGYVTKTS